MGKMISFGALLSFPGNNVGSVLQDGGLLMKKRGWLYLLPLLMLLFSGCAHKSPYITEHPQYTADGAPYWTVLTPISKQRFYGVGSGNLSTIENSKTRAAAMARNEIAQQVSIMVNDVLLNYFTEAGIAKQTKGAAVFDDFSLQVASLTLRNVIVENNWQDPKTGKLWVIASYEKSNLKEAYELEARNLLLKLEKQKQQLANDLQLKLAMLEQMKKDSADDPDKLKLIEEKIIDAKLAAKVENETIGDQQGLLDLAGMDASFDKVYDKLQQESKQTFKGF